MTMNQKITTLFKKYHDTFPYLIWGVSVLSMFGSLYFSEIMHLQPCKLCWWQRIFMYPIAFILSVAILRKDTKAYLTVLPLSSVGMVIAFYHTLLQANIIKETLVNCTVDGAVSCANAQINWFGFMTIPFMSFISFFVITSLCVISIFNDRPTKETSKK
jgi:disulfide bond formation protein DsbB